MNEAIVNKLQLIINTLNATELRVDQEKAINRILACVSELEKLKKELTKDADNE